MASHNLVRKLVSAASCLPIRRSQLLGSNAANGMTVVRNQPKVRYASTATRQYTPEEKGGQLESRDDGAIFRDRVSPLQVFDLMDSVLPTRNLRSMIETMDRIFDDPLFAPSAFRDSPVRRSLRTPWDFKETEDSFQLRMDMPGLDKQEVKVYIEDDCLVIKGEHNAERKSEEDQWSSRSHGSYSSRIMLPDNADPEKIKAEMKNGVLNVTVPKVREEERKKNVIDVSIE
ncbi:hypothetical protein Mapa_012119 [Marchantia paleacea]|nr:hypothetical protein Mapa_012119 [Marchantia paleacea]